MAYANNSVRIHSRSPVGPCSNPTGLACGSSFTRRIRGKNIPHKLFPQHGFRWLKQGFIYRPSPRCCAINGDSDEFLNSDAFQPTPLPDSQGDWRSFRARLISLESQDSVSNSNKEDIRQVTGDRWAHPLPSLEKGCVLVASNLLDGYSFFERSVVLLLNSTDNEPPYGLVINKSHPKKSVGKIAGMNETLARTFRPCKAFIGGPLDHQRFVLMHGSKGINGFEEIVPGTFFGGVSGIQPAVLAVKKGDVKAEDFRFYFGYAGWDSLQLQNEVKMGWWYVAACSSNIVLSNSNGEDLWKEILLLMGGKYADAAEGNV